MGFWQFEDGALKKKMGIFGSHDKPKYINCLAFLPSGEAITGDSNGNLAVWEAGKNTITNFITDVHDGSIFCIYISKSGNVITGGGKDACLKYFDQNMEKLDEEAQVRLFQHWLVPGNSLIYVLPKEFGSILIKHFIRSK